MHPVQKVSLEPCVFIKNKPNINNNQLFGNKRSLNFSQRQWGGASLKISLLPSIPIFRRYEKGNWRWVMLRWWDRVGLQACYRSYTTSWGCYTVPRQSTLSASKLTDMRSQHWTSISSDTSPGLMIELPQDWAVPAPCNYPLCGTRSVYMSL